jgi:flagellar biosynthesis activator protein FlaF
MYKLSYDEIMDGDPRQARAQEQQALDHAIRLMKAADADGRDSPQAVEAVQYLQKLWTYFIQNLTDPTNELASELKGDLISIGLWAIGEADRVLADKSKGFAALINVNQTIRDGLA